ncbi:hypothetical protein Taro_025444 [Colocasia esculenta]|uniref:Uncharacterized protein n=1 Tax=Colocasia esculenta TaxID=4460 RepID=A0A843VE90_COLES|nr:hypothetical protein [Colocasia esculenta]
MRVATGSTEIATVSCIGRDRLSQVGQQIATTGLVKSLKNSGKNLRDPSSPRFSSWSRNLLARAGAGHESLREVFKLLPIHFPSLSLTPIKFRISYFPLPFLSKRSPIWVGREGISWPINWGRFRNPIIIQTSYLMH